MSSELEFECIECAWYLFSLYLHFKVFFSRKCNLFHLFYTLLGQLWGELWHRWSRSVKQYARDFHRHQYECEMGSRSGSERDLSSCVYYIWFPRTTQFSRTAPWGRLVWARKKQKRKTGTHADKLSSGRAQAGESNAMPWCKCTVTFYALTIAFNLITRRISRLSSSRDFQHIRCVACPARPACCCTVENIWESWRKKCGWKISVIWLRITPH